MIAGVPVLYVNATAQSAQPSELRNTLEELRFLSSGDVAAYYESRARRGDPYAPLALQVVRDEGYFGKAANRELRADIWLARALGRDVNLPTEIDLALRQVNVDLARIYAEQVDADKAGRIHGVLSARQVTVFHQSYFTSIGLWQETFGGTLTRLDRESCYFYWCSDFDTD